MLIEMGSCGDSAMVDDGISGGSVIEQHLCSEIPVHSDHLQKQLCSEGACSVLYSDELSSLKDGSVDLPQEGSASGGAVVADVELHRAKDGSVDLPQEGPEGSTSGGAVVTDVELHRAKGSVDLPQEGPECSTSGSDVPDKCGDVLPNECGNADMLQLENTSEHDCQNHSRICCGNNEGSGLKTRGLCSEGNFQDEGDTDIPSESITVTGLQEHCVQHVVQKDEKLNVFPSVNDDSAVMGGKNDDSSVLVDALDCVHDFRHSEMSLESEPTTDLLVGCDHKNEQGDIVRNADPLSMGVERCDAFDGMESDACRQASPLQMQALEVPTTVCTEEDSRRGQLCDVKYGDDWNSSIDEKIKAFVDKENIVDSHVQVLSSPGCHRTLESSPVVDSPPETSVLVQGNVMKNDILQIDEKLCKLKDSHSEETTNYAPRKPLYADSDQPSIVLVTDTSLKGAHDLLPKGGVVSVNNSSALDTVGQTDNDGKDTVEADFFAQSILLPSQRNSRRNKIGCKTQTKKASRKCNKADLTHPGGDMKINLEVARKKRSSFSKPARSSIWGLLGSIEQYFEQDNELGISKAMCQELGKSRSKRQTGKAFKNSASSSSSNAGQKCSVPTTRVRLKIKFGKEIDLSSSNILIPEIGNAFNPASGMGTGSGSQKVGSNAEDKSLGPVSLGNLETFKSNLKKDDLVLNAQIATNHLESTAKIEKSNGDVEAKFLTNPLEKVVEPLIEPIINMDPGTSPDSEVINSVPEVQVGERHQEDMHHALLGPPLDFNSNLHITISKKGKKKDKHISSSDCITEVGSYGRHRSNKAKQSKNHRCKKNSSNTVSFLKLPASTEINASSKSISSEEFPTEPLPLSGESELGDSAEALKVQGCKPSVNHRPSEPQGSENLPPCVRYLGRKLPKSIMSVKVSKAKSKASDSTKKKITCRHKEKQRRPNSKSEVKGKGGPHKVMAEVEDHIHTATSTVGNGKLDADQRFNADENRVSVNVSNLNILPTIDSGEQHKSPHNAWVRCDDCHKWRRIPAVLADLIDETNCTWTCKDSKDKDFADCAIPQEKSNAEINAELGLSDEEDAYEDSRNYKELEFQQPLVSQESTFTQVLSNEFLHRSRKTQTIDEIMVCHCKQPQVGKLGCGDECLNRMLNIECVQGTCPCGDYCSNQQFQKRKYASLKWFKCGKKGYGLKALENIAQGQFLIEYVGEVLDTHAYEARQREYALKGHRHFYFMTLNGSEVIDASAKGNLGRFINHSCDPNCRTEKWMVNGEICIGLFALRDIKQDEEVTFDYNYVRVFGAAAKKCYCGSINCRGYIGGGDPLNSDLIVQGDSDEEFPEPVMLNDDGVIENGLLSRKFTIAIDADNTPEKESSMNPSSAVDLLHSSIEENSKAKVPSSVRVEEISQLLENRESKTMPAMQQGHAIDLTDKTTSIQKDEKLSSLAPVRKVLLNATISNKEFKPEIVKAPKLVSSVKRGKVCANPPNGLKIETTVTRLQLSSGKLKKVVEGSSNARFEAVQEKLTELLDGDGGISKRKDATKGYLKLLLLTVASGDRSSGEAIQSNRDLSMILDALLKTKSRAVLNDIINKNGLQMLHKIMKQYRRDFKKIPILRKLLKVLEYLAVGKILTFEHINGGPPCHGMESFRESMLSLTEHDDKQVHQIARSFRDRWIPRASRKHGYMDRDDNRMESHRSYNSNRFSSSHNHRHEQDSRPTEAVDCVPMSTSVETSADAGAPEGSSAPSLDGVDVKGTKKRKRKSRWDQPAETNSYSDAAVIGSTDGSQNIHEDVPPGFSCPVGAGDLAPRNGVHSGSAPDLVFGQPKEKFNSRLPVSYGIPCSVVKQFGTPHAEISGSWVTAPGMPFNPFPPLPPYPRDQRDCLPSNTSSAMAIDQPSEIKQSDGSGLVNSCADDTVRSTTGTNSDDMNHTDEENQNITKRLKDDDLGRRYFRQQKWNNSKIHRPWFRRDAWKCNNRNNTSGGDMCGMGVGNVQSEVTRSSEDAICRDEKGGNNIC
ncbi:histone-lysine N-methyltransferase ASHH2 [Arachis stenosperma]|uniref:histone-lysine N-methyltransferase ASHH2 n=1 Tax=Arachis stenosperma TaxID=217475 RepID=UPI0025AC0B51|nr:histone-lysine N-methyltransferase ASHH2 [Arachis stenosperma]XP_057729687.1 histone-lysine N-methyltransferase ASHH2 [Arachis stenosperma]